MTFMVPVNFICQEVAQVTGQYPPLITSRVTPRSQYSNPEYCLVKKWNLVRKKKKQNTFEHPVCLGAGGSDHAVAPVWALSIQTKPWLKPNYVLCLAILPCVRMWTKTFP